MNNKTSSTKLFLSLVTVFFMLISACTKKEIKGPQGDPGTPGAGGNATISSSAVFLITSSLWKVDSASSSLKVSINSALLTKDVVDKGAVKVYLQMGTAWAELPYDSGDLFMQYGFQEGILSLNYINIEGGFPSAPANANYRMVILSESARPAKNEQSDGLDKGFSKTVVFESISKN